MIRKILVSVTLLLAAMSLRGQSVSFVNMPDNARRLAQGGTDVSYSVSRLPERGYSGSVEATFFMWDPGALNLYMLDGYARLGERLALSAKGRLHSIKSYVEMDGNGNLGKTFNPSEYLVGVGLHYRVGNNISLLGQVNLISSKLATNFTGQTVAADIGVAYDMNDISFALTARNVGPDLKYAGSAHSNLPMVVMLGAEKIFGINGNGLDVAVDAGYMPLHSCFVAKVGASFSIHYLVDIMAGYHFGGNDAVEPSYATVGLGLNLSVFELSAAYIISSSSWVPRNSLAFTLGARF